MHLLFLGVCGWHLKKQPGKDFFSVGTENILSPFYWLLLFCFLNSFIIIIRKLTYIQCEKIEKSTVKRNQKIY